MRTLIAAALALALTGGAACAQWTIQQVPLGDGWSSNQATGPQGQSATGTTVPLGDGWSSTTWHDSSGRTTTCRTVPMGEGWNTTTCQ